jgi:DNA ligase-1
MNCLQRNDTPLLRQLLQFTYDPYKKYNIRKLPYLPTGKETIESMWPVIKEVLEQLATGHGDAARKEMLHTVLRDLRRDDADLLTCVVRKDLKAGITATTINKVFNNLIPLFGIMKASQFKDNLWRSDLMGSVKLDGYRCLVRDGELLSSGGFPILGADHILRALEAVEGYSFDGEIMVPGMNFQEGGGAIRSAKVTPDAKLFVFDFIDEPTMPFSHRYALLEALADRQGWSFSLDKPSTITVVRHRAFTSIEEMYHIFNKALYKGYEGLVLKDPNSKYELKRSKSWLKVKNVLDEDCEIVGFYEGEGKYAGMLGGITVLRKNGYISKVGGGFSDDQRYTLWHNHEAYSGKMVEVHYMEDTPDGDFRHARFKRFRPDKD